MDIHCSEQEMRVQILTERIALLEIQLNNSSEPNTEDTLSSVA